MVFARLLNRAWRFGLSGLAALVVFCVQPATADIVQRHVLAIFDSAHEPSSSSTVVHYRAEMPLNHLGYIVEYHDIRKDPLPSVGDMARYRAVVTWFTYDLDRPTEYLEWAAGVAESGVRFIILGNFGGRTSEVNAKLLNRVLAPIGIRYTTDYVEVATGSSATFVDDTLIGFERPLDPVLPSYPIVKAFSDDVSVALEVTPTPNSRLGPSAIVSVGPGGALVVAGFEIYYDPQLERSQWIVNPFELFRRALGEQLFPVPDTTTVSGRRLYFSHVDGDGWNNIAEMDRYQRPPVASAEVMLRELIEPFPDLPVAVGLVAGDLDPILGGGEQAAELARRIYALPQVEVASHTCTHPFYWGFYEDYDRNAELQLLPVTADEEVSTGFMNSIIGTLGFARQRSEQEIQRARYLLNGINLPRAYMRDPFGLGREVEHAVRETEALAPPGKHATLYQWSGDTRPFETIIRATRRAGLRNINGGDTRFDDEYPSVGYVAALSRIAGGERQIYAVNSNENTYTNEWTDHYHGFLSLSETVRRTEYPRRLKGVNVYYHTFSAEKQASLNAVRTHLEWARRSKLAPIKASQYAAIADGFFSTTINLAGSSLWRIAARDGLQTVRFDDAEELDVDFARSHGVVGRARHEGSLYIALDETVDVASVALGVRDEIARLTTVSLDSGRWLVRGLQREACNIRFSTSGYGNGEFAWSGFAPGRYRVEARHTDNLVWTDIVETEDDGQLSFSIAADAIDSLDIVISCASNSNGT
ncbi:MAG: hypothetical protein MEQ84_02540 [Mesorhizobium sp.]|nr:hypothetical protein [Mesorhizobium sp.]